MNKFIAISALLLVGAQVSFGQTTEVSGRVTDPAGQVISGAGVSLVHERAQYTRSTVTNESGYYFFPNIEPGAYRLEVLQEGFKLFRRSGVNVLTADRLALDVAMEIGEVSVTVDVVADASLLQTNSAETAATVDTRGYQQMPLIQRGRVRTPAGFLYLSPAVLGNVSNNGADNTAASNQIQVNGSARFSNELYMDGLPGRTNFNETAPPVDAVQEFKLQANQLSAEYGNTGSSVVSFSIRSGTNELHGSAFEIFRNNVLDARPWLAGDRPPLRQNEFGLTVGGPVVLPKLYNGRNRTFWFFSYTGSRKRGLDIPRRLRIPTPEQIQGDFSGVSDVVYDPLTTRQAAAGAGFVRDPFPNAQIPINRFDPVAVRVSQLFPAPNLTGAGALNYQAFSGERLLDPDTYIAKFNHDFAPRHRMNATLNRTAIPRNNLPIPLPDPINDLTDQDIRSHMLRVNYDATVSNSVLNTFTAGYNNFRNPFKGAFAEQGFAEQFGLRGTVGDAFPFFSFTNGYSNVGRSSLSDSFEQSAIVKNVLSWAKGRQLFKIGGEYRRLMRSSADSANSAGSYAFNRLGTALPGGPATTGDGFASFLLGQVHSASLSFPFEQASRRPYWAIFVQDDFRVTSKLTLNLGFRYEQTLAPWEKDNLYTLVDLDTPNPAAGGRPGASVFAGVGGEGDRLLRSDASAWGPRFGFAYQVFNKTVVRGGYGIFYADPAAFTVNTGLRRVGSFASLDNGVTPAFRLAEGLPEPGPAPSATPGLVNSQNVTARTDSVLNMPRTQNWSLSVQHELARDLLFELSYAANHNTRQTAPSMVNINQVDPRFLSLGSLLTQNINSAAAAAAGIQRPYEGFQGSVAQALRPFPQYLNVTEQSAKAGRTLYHGGTVRLKKRFSSGLLTEGHYTWSKNLGYSEPGEVGFGTSNNMLQNNFDRRAEYSLLPNDVPHALVFYYAYELPFGQGKRFLNQGGVADKLLGGWQVSGIHRYQSGNPLQISMNNNLPIFGRTLRPDAVQGAQRQTDIRNADFDPSGDRRINRQAFAGPAPFRFGTAAPTYGDLRNFPVLAEDFSLIKNTSLNERFELELSAQFINAFNRHRFTGINQNFTNAQFGSITGVSLPRTITLGLRLRY
jgi:hypothetical protein